MINQRRLILLCAWSAAALATGLLTWAALRGFGGRAERSSDPAVVIRVHAADWPNFAVLHPRPDTGWIALPPARAKSDSLEIAAGPMADSQPEQCAECHASHVHGFEQTAHARTMTLPSESTILGSFQPPSNRLETSVPGFYFEMTREDGRFFQEVHVDREGTPEALSIPIAFVMGSGNHGQGFLHWTGDQLCAMPVSYYSEFERWTNSPGNYRDGTADFARPVTTRCLDCHATWFGHVEDSINEYAHSGFLLGVTCARCHGPAGKHVAHHRDHPGESVAKFIVNPASLTREAANEVCSQCHSGPGKLVGPAFGYQPGTPLEDSLKIDLTGKGDQNDDPHSANQLGRLMRSRCYQESESLTCLTCHDPHAQERGSPATFSERCQKCHQPTDCPQRERLGSEIDARCVECHMPSRRDAHVSAKGPGAELLPLLRDHLIAVRPEVSLHAPTTDPAPGKQPTDDASGRKTDD